MAQEHTGLQESILQEASRFPLGSKEVCQTREPFAGVNKTMHRVSVATSPASPQEVTVALTCGISISQSCAQTSAVVGIVQLHKRTSVGSAVFQGDIKLFEEGFYKLPLASLPYHGQHSLHGNENGTVGIHELAPSGSVVVQGPPIPVSVHGLLMANDKTCWAARRENFGRKELTGTTPSYRNLAINHRNVFCRKAGELG